MMVHDEVQRRTFADSVGCFRPGLLLARRKNALLHRV